MKTAWGDPQPPPAALRESARITFCTAHLALKWSHCSSSADFLSRYYAGVLAATRDAAAVRDISHSIAYLANELIENAQKFRTDGDVVIEAGLDGGDFLLFIRNHVAPETATRFQALLDEITVGDPGDLLIQRIEANATGQNAAGSGLGLLTLMNDYGVRLSWKFAPDASGARVFLETLARLPLPAATTPTSARRHHGN